MSCRLEDHRTVRIYTDASASFETGERKMGVVLQTENKVFHTSLDFPKKLVDGLWKRSPGQITHYLESIAITV